MKKIFFIICLSLFSTLYLKAQTPAGNNQEIQFNNNGIFGASPYLKWDGTNLKFLNLGTHSAKLYFLSGSGDDSYIFSENYGSNKNRLVFHTRDDGDQDYAVFRNRHWNDGEKDVFEIHRTWTKANSNFYVMNGNVGIGTTTPETKLHIKGDGLSLRLSPNNYASLGSETGMDFRQLTHNGAFRTGGAIKSISTDSYTEGVGTSYDSHLVLYSAGDGILVEGLRISDLGNIGIGTTTPDAKLAVKGNIHTNEVKVDLLGAVAPDYVFYKDYDLKTLNEVENYITKEGHLPNIPSAKEMETNGLLLKEMNLKLLEKIEELTLYAISQEKRINSLEQENNELKKQQKRIELLEKQMALLLKIKK